MIIIAQDETIYLHCPSFLILCIYAIAVSTISLTNTHLCPKKITYDSLENKSHSISLTPTYGGINFFVKQSKSPLEDVCVFCLD